MENQFITNIGDDILVLEPPPEKVLHWRRSGNIVLVKSDEGISIFDSGGDSSKHLLYSLVKSHLDNQSSSVHCIHTHGHIDHIGGDSLLVKKFNAQIWASDEAIPFVVAQTPLNLKLERQNFIVNFKELFTASEWFVKGVMRLTMGRYKPLKHVYVIESESDPNETHFLPIPTPGHHMGHLGFFNPEIQVFIAGDILDPRYGMKPLLSSPSSNFDELKQSIKRMLGLSIKILIPGHGNPIVGIETVEKGLHTALDTMNKSLQGVIASLSEENQTLHSLSLKLRGMGLGPGDVFRHMYIHSVLKKLYNENKITLEVDKKKQTWFSYSG